MIPADVLTALITISVGAISGGITNAVAVWMLFHPYERRGLGPFKIQGAIPKNKPRLARSMARTVSEKLLTPGDIATRLSTPAIRDAFEQAIGRVVDDAVRTERGPLREILGERGRQLLQDATPRLAEMAGERLSAYTASPAFLERIRTIQASLRADFGDRQISDLLTPERRTAIRERVEGWTTQFARNDDIARYLREFSRNQFEDLARDRRSLLERLPPSLVAAVEQGITDYLPVAVERLGGVLGDPDARRRIQDALRSAFDHTVRDLLLHERIVAKLVVTDRTIERLVDGFERRGLDRLAEGMTEPAVKNQLARAVNEAVVRFLHVPLAERFERLGVSKREALADTLSDWLVKLVRAPGTHRVLADAVDRIMETSEGRTWAQVLDAIPPERVAQLIRDALETPRGRERVADAVHSLVNYILDRPLGRPADWISPAGIAGLRTAVINASWDWVQRQIPIVVGQIKVEEMVEEKIMSFSTQRVEEIVRGVSHRELKLIVNLGYLLGAIVGAIVFGVNLLLR